LLNFIDIRLIDIRLIHFVILRMSRLVRNPAFGANAGGGGGVVSDSVRSQLAAARRSGSLRLGNKSLKEVPPTMRGFAEVCIGAFKCFVIDAIPRLNISPAPRSSRIHRKHTAMRNGGSL
jgi:hypothetical protein